MKVEIQTSVSSIALTKKEIEILDEAQSILDRLYDNLEEVDIIEDGFRNILRAIDGIGDSLNYIATFVDIEDYFPT